MSEREARRILDDYAPFWIHEGIAWYGDNVPADPGMAPVYRFWSDSLQAHFYTIRESEMRKLHGRYSHIWTLEGIAFFAHVAAPLSGDTAPAYHFWSDVLSTHFYTMDDTEADKLINEYSHIWTFEGIAWHAYRTAPTYAF